MCAQNRKIGLEPLCRCDHDVVSKVAVGSYVMAAVARDRFGAGFFIVRFFLWDSLNWWYGVGGKAFFLYVFSHFFKSSYHNFKTQKV